MGIGDEELLRAVAAYEASKHRGPSSRELAEILRADRGNVDDLVARLVREKALFAVKIVGTPGYTAIQLAEPLAVRTSASSITVNVEGTKNAVNVAGRDQTIGQANPSRTAALLATLRTFLALHRWWIAGGAAAALAAAAGYLRYFR